MAVATTEPVADYLLEAMGTKNLTPYVFQADIMNGVDPAPEDISLEMASSQSTSQGLCYNQQVVDSLTTSIRQKAKSPVPVVGVYETMPTPGYDYQTWMLAEVAAIRAAVAMGSQPSTCDGNRDILVAIAARSTAAANRAHRPLAVAAARAGQAFVSLSRPRTVRQRHERPPPGASESGQACGLIKIPTQRRHARPRPAASH